jgi:hypothetical protein
MAQETRGQGVTYMDIASRLGPDNKISKIIEMQAQTNEVLEDMVVKEGNLPTGHRTTIRTGLPSATWRLLNYGVQPSKSKTAQVTDKTGMLEAYAEVDKALADLNGNTAEFRLSEDRAFLEAMNQQMASTIFYGNESVYPERFTGLAPRYSVYSTTETNIGFNIVPYRDESAGSGSDVYDMFLVVWGENTIHGIYPKGSVAGFEHQDLLEQTLTDEAGGRYQGYRTHYKWELGISVRDWRYGVRLCNIDLSDLAAETTTSLLLDAMDKCYYKIPNLGMGRAAWYAPPALMPYLQKQAATRAAAALTLEYPTGKPVVKHLGIPIRKCQALVASSDEVTIS